MNPIAIGILCFILGYLAGIATIVLLAQIIKSKFGEEGAKKIIEK